MNWQEALARAVKSLWGSVPILIGVVLLIGLVNVLIPKSVYKVVFTGNYILDPIIGSATGSVLAGSPITSYVLGGEFLKSGVSLVAVTAFIVAWVTVGLVQLPAEMMILGKRFALLRNAVSFLLSILVAVSTVYLVRLL